MHIFRLPFGADAQVDLAYEGGREIELNRCRIEAREEHRGAFGKVVHRLIDDETGAADIADAPVIATVILRRVNHGVAVVAFTSLDGGFPDRGGHLVLRLGDAGQQTPQRTVPNNQFGWPEVFHTAQGMTCGGGECQQYAG